MPLNMENIDSVIHINHFYTPLIIGSTQNHTLCYINKSLAHPLHYTNSSQSSLLNKEVPSTILILKSTHNHILSYDRFLERKICNPLAYVADRIKNLRGSGQLYFFMKYL